MRGYGEEDEAVSEFLLGTREPPKLKPRTKTSQRVQSTLSSLFGICSWQIWVAFFLCIVLLLYIVFMHELHGDLKDALSNQTQRTDLMNRLNTELSIRMAETEEDLQNMISSMRHKHRDTLRTNMQKEMKLKHDVERLTDLLKAYENANTELLTRSFGHGEVLHSSDYMTHDTYLFRSISALGKEHVSPDQIAFVVVSGKCCWHRDAAIQETWGSSVAHLLIVAEEENKEVGAITLPGIEGLEGRENAAKRAIAALKYVSTDEVLSKLRWVLIVDDDTYVNVERVVQIASSLPHDRSIGVGYVWNDEWIKGLDYLSGGAGMLLSMQAVKDIAPDFDLHQTITKQCPSPGSITDKGDKVAHDHAIGSCLAHHGAQILHSNAFRPKADSGSFGEHVSRFAPEVCDTATFHYVDDKSMRSIHTKVLSKCDLSY